MKALLLKDGITLWKQMKVLLLLVVLFSVIPSSFQNVFAIVYASMIPYSAFAFDERSKWPKFAAMLPYSKKTLVLSKYVLGWLSVSGAWLLCTLVQFILHWVAKTTFTPLLLLIALFLALLLLALMLPLMFRFGVEKARLGFVLIFTVFGSTSLLSANQIAMLAFSPLTLLAISVPALILLSACSVFLSVKLYDKNEG